MLRPRSWYRRALTLALSCVLVGGPTVTLAWSASFCPHHHAMQHQHGPCFCDRMVGDAPMDVASPVVLPAPLETLAVPGPHTSVAPGGEPARPASPAFAPGHPPPKPLV